VKNSLQRFLMWFACLLGAAGGMVLLAAPFYSAVQTDLTAQAREETVVSNGVAHYLSEIARKSVAQTVWDDAVAHLDVKFDPEWAHQHIGIYFAQTEGLDAALVLDRDDAPVYAMRAGRAEDPGAARTLAEASAALVRAVRAEEERRGPLREALLRGDTRMRPVLASHVATLDGEPYAIAASLVQPAFGAVMPATSRSAIVVTAKRLDGDFVRALSEKFLLADAELVQGLADAPQGRARALLRHDRQSVSATLLWTPAKPGAEFLNKTLPPTLMLLGSLAGLAAILYRRGKLATQNLISSEARASHLAYHDTLTGLPNRAMLSENLARSIAELQRDGRPFAVLCVDLDHFKEVNDAFGHLAGDELIRAVARCIQTACRDSDLVARLGGDEFAIIQAGAGADCAGALAGRIVSVLSQPIELQVGRVFIGASIGVTLVAEGDDTPQECLRRADLALYRAKAGGRGRFVFFEEEMDATVKTRAALQSDLREALARGELELHYQPQLDGRNEIVGLEALVRWNHKTRGSVSPSAFVPIAEETGLIEALGMFTLRRAFEDSKNFPGVKIAVNVSAAQLRRKDFADQLQALVEECAVSPENFELEITEGLLLGDDPHTHEALQRLRSLGFTIALDDFGTGYSSLSYLQRYPIDKIKIDRSFIARLGAEPRADAVVTAMVRLARALGLSVIAEGVETEAQRLSLTVAGCPDVQGFLTGRPMRAEAAAVLLAEAEAPLRATG
jgi:diguanylate cyclase (GGDEF)-like protein